MNLKLKVLFASRGLPTEGGGGTSVYRLSLLRYLRSLGCEIKYVNLHYKGENLKELTSQIKYFDGLFEVIDCDTYKDFPIWSDMPFSNEIRFVEEKARINKPDLLIVDHPWLCGLITKSIKHRSITAILTHDVQYKKIAAFKKYKIRPYKRNIGKDPYWSMNQEKNLLKRASIILAIQKEDVRTFSHLLPSKEIIYLPMAFKPQIEANPLHEVKGRCLFVGGSAEHNTLALKWFLNNVWPLIIKENKDAHLNVCGEVSQTIDVSEYGIKRNIHFLGKVGDLDLQYREAQVCIVPLIVGSGLKIKLVEAMAHGKACVSTSVGLQGIKEVKNYGVLVSDKSVDFAKNLSYILNNDRLRCLSGLMNLYFSRTYLTEDAAYGPFILSVLRMLRDNKR